MGQQGWPPAPAGPCRRRAGVAARAASRWGHSTARPRWPAGTAACQPHHARCRLPVQHILGQSRTCPPRPAPPHCMRCEAINHPPHLCMITFSTSSSSAASSSSGSSTCGTLRARLALLSCSSSSSLSGAGGKAGRGGAGRGSGGFRGCWPAGGQLAPSPGSPAPAVQPRQPRPRQPTCVEARGGGSVELRSLGTAPRSAAARLLGLLGQRAARGYFAHPRRVSWLEGLRRRRQVRRPVRHGGLLHHCRRRRRRHGLPLRCRRRGSCCPGLLQHLLQRCGLCLLQRQALRLPRVLIWLLHIIGTDGLLAQVDTHDVALARPLAAAARRRRCCGLSVRLPLVLVALQAGGGAEAAQRGKREAAAGQPVQQAQRPLRQAPWLPIQRPSSVARTLRLMPVVAAATTAGAATWCSGVPPATARSWRASSSSSSSCAAAVDREAVSTGAGHDCAVRAASAGASSLARPGNACACPTHQLLLLIRLLIIIIGVVLVLGLLILLICRTRPRQNQQRRQAAAVAAAAAGGGRGAAGTLRTLALGLRLHLLIYVEVLIVGPAAGERRHEAAAV